MEWQIGDVTITQFVDIETLGGTAFILPQATPDAVRSTGWLRCLTPQSSDSVGKGGTYRRAKNFDAPAAFALAFAHPTGRLHSAATAGFLSGRPRRSHTSTSAAARPSISASVCQGDGVMRSRSVPLGTVG
jgi:hypothetical protein